MMKIRKKAIVLVSVLWIVVLLGVIAAITSRQSRIETKTIMVKIEQERCRWACRAAQETAMEFLATDSASYDSLTDLWYDNPDEFNDIPLDRCSFNVRVSDESAKLNINTATKQQFLALENMSEQIADAILDWRDKDQNLRPEGAEAGYYGNLNYPYEIRNSNFLTVRELLKVKDVTAQLLYGEDTNLNGELDFNERDGDDSPPMDNSDDILDAGWFTQLTCYSYDKNLDSQGNKRININKADEKKLIRSLKISKAQAKWIIQKRKHKSIADLINNNSPQSPPKGKNGDDPVPIDLQTFKKIVDKITINDKKQIAGRVNVNTATQPVLEALLGGEEKGAAAAQKIISARQSSPMDSIADLLNNALSVTDFKKIADFVTIRSNVFLVQSVAVADRADSTGARFTTEAVIDRGNNKMKILYYREGL
jgi:type II secretory pathway component PulK